MTRKGALSIAAGVVAALMAGMVAFTIGRGLTGSASAAQVAPKPIVKTITKVITVKKHQKSKVSQPATITVVRQRPGSGSVGSTTMASSSSYHGDDSYEHDSMEGDSSGGGGGGD